MLFADPGIEGEASFTFFNFATRQSLRGHKLPAEAVAELVSRRRPPPPPKKIAHRATASSLAAQTTKQASPAKGSDPLKEKPPPSPPAPSPPKAQAVSKETLGNVRGQSVTVRKSALSLRPRGLPEMLVAAQRFGVDLVTEPNLLWIVDLCMACDYLPAGWESVPRDSMAKMNADSTSGEVSKMMGGMGSNPTPASTRPISTDVEWLPPLERLFILASTGEAPPQYSHQLCSLVTERHPLDGFVRSLLGFRGGPGMGVMG